MQTFVFTDRPHCNLAPVELISFFSHRMSSSAVGASGGETPVQESVSSSGAGAERSSGAGADEEREFPYACLCSRALA